MARGSVYRPTYKVAGKTKKQAVWWIAYRQDGKLVRKSSGTKLKGEADRQLRKALVDVDEGIAPPPGDEPTVADLRRLVLTDYAINNRRSAREVKRAFRHLEGHFKERRVSKLTVADVDEYKEGRLGDMAARASVNRELAMLRRGFRLAVKKGRLRTRPDFSLLVESNRRKGFFEPDEFEAIVMRLPDHLQPLMQFLYWTGWRSSEALALEWQQVDRKTGVIRIEDTKSDEPRTLPYGVLPELVDVVGGQWVRAEALRREHSRIVKHVFCTGSGARIYQYASEWDAARKAAGLPGRLVHDMRRTAARRMLRSGIPQSVAMQLGGWKTASVFRRYAIVDESVLAENLKKLATGS